MLEMYKMCSVELSEIWSSTHWICIVKMQAQATAKANLADNTNKLTYQ